MILKDIEQRGLNGNKQIAQAIKEMLNGTESLKNAHAHATDQLSRLIPSIQERAKGLSDITQITGKQLTHTLQSLATSEISLKNNAEQAKETLTKLSSTADDLGERLFGAINLLQASGKVLNDTSETIKSDWASLNDQQDLGGRLDDLSVRLSDVQEKLLTQAEAQNGLAQAIERNAENNQLPPDLIKESILDPLTAQMIQITEYIKSLQEKLEEQKAVMSANIAAPGDNGLPDQMKDVNEKLAQLIDLDGRVAVFVSAIPGDVRQALKEEIQGLSERNDINGIQDQLNALHAALGTTQAQDTTDQINKMGQLLAAHIDERRTDLDGKLSGIEEKIAATQRTAETIHDELAKMPAPQNGSPADDLHKQFIGELALMSGQIEALRENLAASLSEQLHEIESRLTVERSLSQTKTTADYALQVQIEKQTEILSELVGTLSLVDAHIQQLKSSGSSAA